MAPTNGDECPKITCFCRITLDDIIFEIIYKPEGIDQELIKMQMGHADVGESPLSKYSTFPNQICFNELNEKLEDMLNHLGWQARSSLLGRRRRNGFI